MANERANDGLLPMIATVGSLSAAAILGMLAYKSATRNLAKKSSSIISDVVQSQQNQSRSIPKSKPQSNTSTSANQSTFSWSEPATSPSEVIARHQRNNNSSSVNKDNIISSFPSAKISEPKQSAPINQSPNIKTTEIESPIVSRVNSISSQNTQYNLDRFNPISVSLPDNILKFISESKDWNKHQVNKFIDDVNLKLSPKYLKDNNLSMDDISFFGVDSDSLSLSDEFLKKDYKSNPLRYNFLNTLEDVHSSDVTFDVITPGIILNSSNRILRQPSIQVTASEEANQRMIDNLAKYSDSPNQIDNSISSTIPSLPSAPAAPIPIPTSSTIQSYVPNTSLDLVNINWGRKAVDPITNQVVFQTGTSNIVNHSGRMMTLVNINGTHMPFYLSTGQGGKAGVPAGKWYPFFGLGKEEGWINKTNDSEINNYYGSDILRKISHQLDNEIGDIRGSKDVEKIYYKHSLADINKHMNPADNEKSNTKQLVRDNINQVLAKIHSNQKS